MRMRMSTSLWRTAWCSTSGWPKVFRWRAHASASSKQTGGESARARRHEQPLAVEVVHDRAKALVLCADQVSAGRGSR
jgi:hypothetical protein